MLVRLYQVTTPFRWAKRDYAVGDLIELRLMSHLRHKTIAGKVTPYNIDSTRAKAFKAESPSQAPAGPAVAQRGAREV